MTNRSAHATIKGYFYQFDHTIVRVLEATTSQSTVVVEGIEDIDLDDADSSTLVQCKYYEGSAYNHSLIKDAVIQMLRHYNAAGCAHKFKYRIYGHYKEGQEKLQTDFDLNFLKRNFLTYNRNKVTHKVHEELGVSDAQLEDFRNLLEIDIHAPSYDEQQSQVHSLLVSHIPDCSSEDAKTFYYPNAINVVQSLAIQADISARKITKASFVTEVNRKEIVFNHWLRKKFGKDYYAKLIKRKHFKFFSTKVPKSSRIFVIDMTDEFNLSATSSLLTKLSTFFSHVEHKRTPQSDRFCPYILLRGLPIDDLVSIKRNLLDQGINFTDGYPFSGSEFYPKHLTAPPTKENQIRLKFIPTVEQIPPVISEIKSSVIEIFDFYKKIPIDSNLVPASKNYNAIKVESAYFINEVLTA